MSHTSTIYISPDRLRARGPSAGIVIRLMVACNDMSLANQALTDWKKEQPRRRKSRQTAAGMYFVRMQLAHLHEALKIVEELRTESTLMQELENCDQETQASFQKLLPFLRGGSNRAELEQLVGRIRNNLTFHYNEDGKLIANALADADFSQSSITRGSTAHLWHFKIADDIVDHIVVRQIWKVPKTVDLRAEAEVIPPRNS